MADYNIDAINGCMQKAQDFKSKFGQIADTFPTDDAGSGAYGKLPSSEGVASAVSALSTAMNKEFSAAETKLDGVARSLDAVAQSVQNMDEDHAAAMTV